MSTPSLLIGFTLILWGLKVGFPWVGVALAFLLEGSRLVSRRWVFSPADLRRVVILCNILLGLLLLYGFLQISNQHRVVHLLVQWLPLPLYPLILVQAYGADEQIDIRSLSLFIERYRHDTDSGAPPLTINLAWPYWAICLLAAAVVPSAAPPWFYGGIAILITVALWGGKSSGFARPAWLLVLAVVIGAGLSGHIWLHRLQGKVEERVTELFTNATGGAEADPNRSRTSIGNIGSLKLSDRIMLRVSGKELKAPLLLREAVYTSFVNTTWVAREPLFRSLQSANNGKTWLLIPSATKTTQMKISAPLEKGKGLLPLPSGTSEITGLQVDELRLSRLGVISVNGASDLVSYLADYNPEAQTGGPPTELDLQVPVRLQPAVAKIVKELELDRYPPDERLNILLRYFNGQFRYTTSPGSAGGGNADINDFLLKSKAGHCEYFATATVLLLRSSGIPARYSTGYSVQEFSKLENAYIARLRHAHAWCQVYINGVWRDLDTTPPVWYSQEQQASSGFQALADLAEWARFRFAEWMEQGGLGRFSRYTAWLLLPFLLYPLWKFFRSIRRKKPADKKEALSAPPILPGLDSEWYLMERELKSEGFVRQPWEPLIHWAERIGDDLPSSRGKARLLRVLELHYRHRFDPKGLSDNERKELRDGAGIE